MSITFRRFSSTFWSKINNEPMFQKVIPRNFLGDHPPLVAVTGFLGLGIGLAVIMAARTLLKNPDVVIDRFNGVYDIHKYKDTTYRIVPIDYGMRLPPVYMDKNKEIQFTYKK